MREALLTICLLSSVFCLPSCGGGGNDPTHEGESESEGEGESESESEGECDRPEYGCHSRGEDCDNNNNCANGLWCVFSTCEVCTPELAQEAITFCENPDNVTDSTEPGGPVAGSYCSAMPDRCPGSNTGCPCCPSTGAFGCISHQRTKAEPCKGPGPFFL